MKSDQGESTLRQPVATFSFLAVHRCRHTRTCLVPHTHTHTACLPSTHSLPPCHRSSPRMRRVEVVWAASDRLKCADRWRSLARCPSLLHLPIAPCCHLAPLASRPAHLMQPTPTPCSPRSTSRKCSRKRASSMRRLSARLAARRPSARSSTFCTKASTFNRSRPPICSFP